MQSLVLIWHNRATETSIARTSAYRIVFLLSLLLGGGCFYIGKNQTEDIVERPSSEWSSRDCLTIMMQAMGHNIFDQYSPNVKVIATPYSPTVITALNRTEQQVKHLSEDDYRLNVDQQMWEDLGLYVDWNSRRMVDARGNYYRSVQQIDTVSFLITIENKNWPCVSPILVFGDANRPLLTPADYPCYTPYIGHLEDSIYLYDDKNQFIKPKSVRGRQRDELTMGETLLAKFRLRHGDHHFLTGVETMYLVIKGFDARVKLEFPLRPMVEEFHSF